MSRGTSTEPSDLARLYNNIVPPSQLPAKANYYLFKVGVPALASFLITHAASHHPCLRWSNQESIIPAWEDAANKDGGKWSIQMPRDKTREKIDQMWMYTVRTEHSPPLELRLRPPVSPDARRHRGDVRGAAAVSAGRAQPSFAFSRPHHRCPPLVSTHPGCFRSWTQSEHVPRAALDRTSTASPSGRGTLLGPRPMPPRTTS